MMGEIVIKIARLVWISIADDEMQALEDGKDLLMIKRIYTKVLKERIHGI